MGAEKELIQGTEDWLRFRSNKIGASEVAALLGLSEWDTAYTIWMKKTGRKDEAKKGQSVSFVVDRGNRFEAAVRARYELINDLPMNPEVFVHPDYPFISASLDGWNEEKKLVLEIKCCGREVMSYAKDGKVHPKYCPQLEQQLLCSGGEMAHFYAASIGTKNGKEQILDAALVEYRSNPELKQKVLDACLWFWPFVEKDIRPPLTENDVLIVEDPDAKELFSRTEAIVRSHDAATLCLDAAEFAYEQAKKEYERIDKELSLASKEIAGVLDHPRMRSGDLYVFEKNLKSGKTLNFKIKKSS